METKKFAVIGHPIGHTMSPFIHTRLFELQGVKAEYTKLDIAPENLEYEFKNTLSKLDGFNITIPHKQAVIPFLDEIDAKALCDEIRKTVAGCDVSFCLIDELSGDIDVLINATPIGMFPKIENQPVSDSVINRCANVFDAVYNPLEKMLVKKARANGATAESGMAMLVWQAVVSHEHWDGSVYDKGDIAQLCIDSAKELEKNF